MQKTLRQIITNPAALCGLQEGNFRLFNEWVYKYKLDQSSETVCNIAKEDEKFFSPLYLLLHIGEKSDESWVFYE